MNWIKTLPRVHRDVLVISLCVGLVLLVNAFFWWPWFAQIKSQRQQLHALQSDLVLFEKNKEVLRAQPTKSSGNLLARINALSRDHGIALGHVQPQGVSRVSLTSSDQPIEALLRWLWNMEQQGLQLEKVSLNSGRQQGTLSVRLVVVAGD